MPPLRAPRANLICRNALKRLRSGHQASVATEHQCRFFNNTTPIVESDSLPPDPPIQTPLPSKSSSTPLYPSKPPQPPQPPQASPINRAYTPRYDLSRAPTAPKPQNPSSVGSEADLQPLPSHLRSQLLQLATQAPHYIIIQIHGKPYLVTPGDTIRLPFLMHGVMPGDVLRLDRATQLGSREWTLRAGAAKGTRSAIQAQSPSGTSEEGMELTSEEPIIGKTADLHPSVTQSVPHPNASTQLRKQRPKSLNRPGYIDSTLFVCRATVLGTESEPLRIKEKTKRRQRHVRHVKSKHRYTILRVSEVTIRGLEGDVEI